MRKPAPFVFFAPRVFNNFQAFQNIGDVKNAALCDAKYLGYIFDLKNVIRRSHATTICKVLNNAAKIE